MRLKALWICISLLCFAGSTAQAQISVGGDQPILIKADKATYKGKATVLEGKVDVRQGEAQIFADEMQIFRDGVSEDEATASGLGLGTVTRIIARGNFKYVTPENTVTGNQGVYVRRAGRITVTGNVVLRQPSGNKVSGKKLIYDIERKSAKFGDECVGENCNGRVSFETRGEE